MAARITKLTQHLAVYHGPINVGILHEGRKALLFDCGDGSVAEALGDLGVTTVEQIVFTHHHRDQACGAHAFAAQGARIGVPAAERDYFDNVAAYWNDPKNRWRFYATFHPHRLMLAEPVRVDAAFGDGHAFAWGPAKVRVLTTPGHTNGSVSYEVEVDGKRVIFCGDVIYDAGQVWDIHCLQKGFQNIGDYHGFLGARPQLQQSLGRLKAAQPDALVPSHGHIMTDPPKAVDALIHRLDLCYDKYVAIQALRHYFPNLFTEYANRPDHMPLRKGKPVPPCLRHIGVTWILVSKDKAAFVMDAGDPGLVKEVQKLIEKGDLRTVEGLWVTHYHFDHTDGIPAFLKAFDCPCITDPSVASVISDPMAWRLPCISPEKCRVDRVPRHGESWPWHEFKLTAYTFPGQTLYHSGLLVEGDGLRMFFGGDSFTMAGIDDYCAYNRNWLGAGVGYDRCLSLLEQLQPTHIFNCHVADAFDFTPEQCRFMHANLAEREKLYGQLLPWDHPNFGLEDLWVRCHPYEQQGRAGEEAAFRVVVTNHAAEAREAACRAVLPRAWTRVAQPPSAVTTDWQKATLRAKAEGEVRLAVRIPADVKPGRYVIPVDVRLGDRELPQFAEAIVVV